MVSYGITLWSANGLLFGPAMTLLVAGALVGLFGAILKHVRLS
jgi:hypothetical protein